MVSGLAVARHGEVFLALVNIVVGVSPEAMGGMRMLPSYNTRWMALQYKYSTKYIATVEESDKNRKTRPCIENRSYVCLTNHNRVAEQSYKVAFSFIVTLLHVTTHGMDYR